MKAYNLRFSDANAGAGSQSLGLQQPKTLARGQTVRVRLTEAEADHFTRDEAYTLSIPEILDVEDHVLLGPVHAASKPKKKATKADKEK